MIIRQPPKLTNRQNIIKYIEADLWTWLKDIATGILKINFQDNFQSFTVQDLEIPAGQEVAIPNGFLNAYPGVIPTGRFIVRQQGDANIIDGTTAWSAELVYLRNPSANDATVTVIFFR